MPEGSVREQLDALIQQLDESKQRQLLAWASTLTGGAVRSEASAEGASPGPLFDMLGIRNEHMESGRSVYALDVRPDLLNPNGVLHGGAVYTMIDYGMGGATMSALPAGQICATIEIKISYLASVRSGTLRAETNVVKQGRRIVFLESKVSDQNGKLVATATGSFAVIQLQEGAGA
jgi:acyl-CoA thioesterase